MKVCPDCDFQNEDAAVSCTDCGSLFADQIGIEIGKRKERESTTLRSVPVDTTEITETRGSTVLVCRACGAVTAANHARCTVCGSDQIVPKSASALSAAKSSRKGRLSAWDRRPKKGVVDGEFANISSALILTFIGVAVLKLILCTTIGMQIIQGYAGPQGLHPYTASWKWFLGPVLLLDAFLAAIGAVGLFSVRKYGAILMAVSLWIDVVLFGWILFYSIWGTFSMFPGTGAYFFFACACLVAGIDLMYRALKGDML